MDYFDKCVQGISHIVLGTSGPKQGQLIKFKLYICLTDNYEGHELLKAISCLPVIVINNNVLLYCKDNISV